MLIFKAYEYTLDLIDEKTRKETDFLCIAEKGEKPAFGECWKFLSDMWCALAETVILFKIILVYIAHNNGRNVQVWPERN